MPLSYFAVSDPTSSVEQLWLTDGTVAGTHMVQAFDQFSITQLAMVGRRVFFAVNDGTHGNELWTSDGTTAGTMLVEDINPGPSDSISGFIPGIFTAANGTLFFPATDGTHGTELWKSDGTVAGTAMVKDVNPGAGDGFGLGFGFITDVNGTVYFAGNDGSHGFELWKSDGTAAGTVMVKDINPAGDAVQGPMINVNGTLFFSADDGTHGFELWKSDGTAAGTVMVKDINPTGDSVVGTNFVNFNGTLFFSANDGTHGVELWKSDGTVGGTVMVADINSGLGDSAPQNFAVMNGELFFSADDGAHGAELWESDGSPAGTMMVKDINLGVNSSQIQGLINVNGTLFFNATDGIHGSELWKSDGTAAGTVMVADINGGSNDSNPQQLTNANGMLEFFATKDSKQYSLFRSDGTAAGTIEIASNVDQLVPIGVVAQAAVVNDMNGDFRSDILWRNANGALAGWLMNGGTITSGNFVTANGAVVAPGPSWSVAGISDFNGDGSADVLWRNSADGTLADWTMNGSVISSGAALTSGGVAATLDASWSVAGTGDFDGDSRADILWRNTSGEVGEWQMNGSTVLSSGDVTFNGTAVKPDATWSVAGIGDFNGDNRKDILWRNNSGEISAWMMNGTAITSASDLTFGGSAVKPDAGWSVAGVGDFNHDGNSDLLWRNSNGSLNEWLMNGTTITSSAAVTFNGSAVTPDASWHVVEIGDFNGDSNSDILWRNDSGALAEWLMNGSSITQSVMPSSGALPLSPDATWSTQAKPTNFG